MDPLTLRSKPWLKPDFAYNDPPAALNPEEKEAFLYWGQVYQEVSRTWPAEEKEAWFARLQRFTTKMPDAWRAGLLSDHPAYRLLNRCQCRWAYFVFLDVVFADRTGESPKLRDIARSNFPGVSFPLREYKWPEECRRAPADENQHMEDHQMGPDDGVPLQGMPIIQSEAVVTQWLPY